MARNREAWTRKPLLRNAYQGFYTDIREQLDYSRCGKIVELGSGLGNIKTVIPECVTTDIFENPWLDRVEDAYRLSFSNGEVGNLILFDVFHHLQYPGSALKEFHRVLETGGRLIIFEPAAGRIGRAVYGLFHSEPLALDQPICWEAPEGSNWKDFGYYAAQGNATRIFVKGEHGDKLAEWETREVKFYSGLAYVATGGFRGPQLCPEFLWPLLCLADKGLSRIRGLASRILVVLRKLPVG